MGKKGRRPVKSAERKDRVVQARVPEDLDETLREAARRRRMTVSQLVRNVLESTFQLVDDIVVGTANLTETVTRDARQLVASVKGEERTGPRPPGSGATADDTKTGATAGASVTRPAKGRKADPAIAVAFDTLAAFDATGIYAWQEVLANRAETCARCQARLDRGDKAMIALTDGPVARCWICLPCSILLRA